MANQNQNQGQYKEVVPFWDAQGQTAFVKAKGDWMDYDKIHLSFVKHSGKNKGCKQELAIEGAVSVHGADGALYLAELILSGKAAAMAKAGAEKNEAYPEPFFKSMGGTPASRSKDGKCTFREFSICKGSRADYAFQMVTCDGEENATGGIQPAKGAKKERINVGVSRGDLVDFASSLKIAWQTHCTVKAMKELLVPAESSPAPVTQSTPVSVGAQDGDAVAILYATTKVWNNGIPRIIRKENTVGVIKDALREVLESKYVADKDSYNDAVKMIETLDEGCSIIKLNHKEDNNSELSLVVRLTIIG